MKIIAWKKFFFKKFSYNHFNSKENKNESGDDDSKLLELDLSETDCHSLSEPMASGKQSPVLVSTKQADKCADSEDAASCEVITLSPEAGGYENTTQTAICLDGGEETECEGEGDVRVDGLSKLQLNSGSDHVDNQGWVRGL